MIFYLQDVLNILKQRGFLHQVTDENKLDDLIEDIEHDEKTVHKKHMSSDEKAEKIRFIKKQEQKKQKSESDKPFPKWKRKILKKYLKKHGLPRGGTGKDLQQRVALHQKKSKKRLIKRV